MIGRFIAVVGPSGVGKDSVMEALAAHDPRLIKAQRVITRPGDAGGETFESVSEKEFFAREAEGRFALSWSAHGLRYAIPVSVDAHLQAGQDVLANLSRAVLVAAQKRFVRFAVISLSADYETLSGRLAGRGRETAEQIQQRLNRVVAALPDGIETLEIDNSGSLSQTATAIAAHLYPVRA
jgi:ribose 1,5-bisphosphokinase